MNAAARLVHQNILSRHLLLTHLLSRQQICVVMLALAVLLSALSTIYITHMTRLLHADYQHNLMEQQHLHILRSQLLLERSTWIIPAKIEEVAEDKLGMIVPEHKAIIVIHE
ncbi:MAG: cell division protein FtsL [Gammaproteobacteria bacterium]|nr:cell division protein FtsL [Gammaproteobacteria bacterium]